MYRSLTIYNPPSFLNDGSLYVAENCQTKKKDRKRKNPAPECAVPPNAKILRVLIKPLETTLVSSIEAVLAEVSSTKFEQFFKVADQGYSTQSARLEESRIRRSASNFRCGR